MTTQSPAPPKDGAFFAPGNRLVASIGFAAAKLSPKANSRATAARWREERPGPDKQRSKSQSAKLDLCPNSNAKPRAVCSLTPEIAVALSADVPR